MPSIVLKSVNQNSKLEYKRLVLNKFMCAGMGHFWPVSSLALPDPV